MRRKRWAVWALAAVMALAAVPVTALAEGWEQSGSDWVYIDANGDRVYNTWKKGADNQWRYLDGDGVMATNAWVDNDYYVDSDGIMLVEKWLKVSDDDGDFEWYYFGSSGKKIEDNWKKIDDQWYHFDDDGRLEFGWILDDMYFTGSDGVMRTGWQKLIPPDDYDEESDYVTPGYETIADADDGKYWYYFGTNGKKYLPSDSNSSGDYGTRKIDGSYYCFDDDGALQVGWQKVRDDEEPEICNYMYFGADGKAKTGWYSIEPPDDIDGYDGDVEWFYFTNSGKPRASDSENLSTSDLVRINGKSYLFNELGNPVWGLKQVYIGSSEENWTAFYFGTKAKSCVQTGKMTVEEEDGNTTTFYFSDNGRGYTGVKDSHLYYRGKLQVANDGQKYMCICVDDSNYVVNASGKVMKGTTVKTSDGIKFKTSSSGTLSSVEYDDEELDVEDFVNEPEEPLYTE